MRGDKHVVHVLAGINGIGRTVANAVHHVRQAMENLDTGFHQFPAHHDRHEAAYQAGKNRKPQVHRADVLVIGRVDIAFPT